MKSGQKVFLGHSVRDAATIIDPQHTPDSKNVDITSPIGALSSMKGIEKYTNLFAGGAVTAIHMLDGRIFMLGNTGVGALPGKLYIGLDPTLFGFPRAGAVGTRVQFIDCTYDPYGDIATWGWSFGDGSTSTDQHPDHTYNTAGLYTVFLKVFCSFGDKWFGRYERGYICISDSDTLDDIPAGVLTDEEEAEVPEGATLDDYKRCWHQDTNGEWCLVKCKEAEDGTFYCYNPDTEEWEHDAEITSEPFTGTVINLARWNRVQTGLGVLPTQDGHLIETIASGDTAGLSEINCQGLMKLTGDFTVQIKFKWVTFPAPTSGKLMMELRILSDINDYAFMGVSKEGSDYLWEGGIKVDGVWKSEGTTPVTAGTDPDNQWRWAKIIRVGATATSYFSVDGSTWYPVATDSDFFTGNAWIRIFVSRAVDSGAVEVNWDDMAASGLHHDTFTRCIPESLMPDDLKPHIAVTEDSYVFANNRDDTGWEGKDDNFGSSNYLLVHTSRRVFGLYSEYYSYRSYLKRTNSVNATLYICCYVTNNNESREITVYEVDPDDWSEDTLTWNNQPSLGSILATATITSAGWKTFDVGTAKSVCIKMTTEYDDWGSAQINAANFYSKDLAGTNHDPYFVRK